MAAIATAATARRRPALSAHDSRLPRDVTVGCRYGGGGRSRKVTLAVHHGWTGGDAELLTESGRVFEVDGVQQWSTADPGGHPVHRQVLQLTPWTGAKRA